MYTSHAIDNWQMIVISSMFLYLLGMVSLSAVREQEVIDKAREKVEIDRRKRSRRK